MEIGKLALLSDLNVNTEEVPNMSIGKPVTLMKCGPTRLRLKVLTRLSGTQAFPMATPDATGGLLMAQVFIQSYQFPENASSAKETVPRHHRRGSYIYNRKHGPCDR